MSMTIDEIRGSALDNNQIGSSGVAGVHTKVIFGNPAKAGFYTILLFVPAHATILAHSHRDDRVASVLRRMAFRIRRSFRRRIAPAARNHYARTDAEPVIVEICSFGPTDTRYFDPANDPRSKSSK